MCNDDSLILKSLKIILCAFGVRQSARYPTSKGWGSLVVPSGPAVKLSTAIIPVLDDLWLLSHCGHDTHSLFTEASTRKRTKTFWKSWEDTIYCGSCVFHRFHTLPRSSTLVSSSPGYYKYAKGKSACVNALVRLLWGGVREDAGRMLASEPLNRL